MNVIKHLEKGYQLIQTNYEGWVSFWIRDPHGDDIETFASVKRAMDYWKMNKKDILSGAETPEYRRAKNEVKKLVRRMGGNFDLMPKEEQNAWIKECAGKA